MERIISVMGEDVRDNMLEIDAVSNSSQMRLHGFISNPILRRASSVDQYLFVNGRPVKDKVLVAALRASMLFCSIIHCIRSLMGGFCASGSLAMASIIMPLTVCSFEIAYMSLHSFSLRLRDSCGVVSQIALLKRVKKCSSRWFILFSFS